MAVTRTLGPLHFEDPNPAMSKKAAGAWSIDLAMIVVEHPSGGQDGALCQRGVRVERRCQ